MSTEIRDSFLGLKQYVEDNNFKGYDPYDGLNSPIISKTPLKNSRFFRLAWIQLFKRNPINLRPLVGIDKEFNPKGLGLFLDGYCNLFYQDESQEYFDKVNQLAMLLINIKTPGYKGACWGYNFDWQARAFFQPKGTPTVVATSFNAKALLKAYNITKNEQYLETALSSSDFVTSHLNRSYAKDGSFSFSYSPLDNTQVYNASLLGARLLAENHTYVANHEWLELAELAVKYVVNAQSADGSWAYGTLPYHSWVDNFHTGYNLECIYEFQKFSGISEYDKSIEKGLQYYLNNFFTSEGASKYYNNKLYPIDIHAPAQLIVTLSRLGILEENKEMCEQVLKWTIRNMQSESGYFYYQIKRHFNSKIPYIRWAQAWMFYAFTYYFFLDKK